jgi:hypothetical protein
MSSTDKTAKSNHVRPDSGTVGAELQEVLYECGSSWCRSISFPHGAFFRIGRIAFSARVGTWSVVASGAIWNYARLPRDRISADDS